MDSSHLMLMCDEELPLLQPTPLPSPLLPQREPPLQFVILTPEESNQIILNFVERERRYAPQHGYAEHLRSSVNLSAARFKSLQWLISTCARLNLSLGTAFNAANYLDRFVSMRCFMRWEGWMMELLGIVCLSIASKLDEVSIPSLHDLQMEDLDHSFHPSTIEKMELVVLKALDWRLSCVTPYSYVHPLICRTDSPHGLAVAQITDLLLYALLDNEFLSHSASSIAASAFRCCHPLDSSDHLSIVMQLISDEQCKEKMDFCHKTLHIMKKSWQETKRDPSSPDTVLPLQRNEIFECYIDVFIEAPNPRSMVRKRKGKALLRRG